MEIFEKKNINKAALKESMKLSDGHSQRPSSRLCLILDNIEERTQATNAGTNTNK
jgi:hypothetical protein